MSKEIKILGFAGSTREDSYNKKLVKIALNGAQIAGVTVKFIDLRDYPLPLYDQDLEDREGIPANARKLKDLFIEHHGFLIASPEYNSSISAVLKNTIDWTSRPEPDEPSLVCFTNKIAALMSASPGILGGLRGLVHLRAILGNINVMLLPDQKAIADASKAFNYDGSLKNPKMQAEIENIGAKLATILIKLNS